MTNPQNSHDKNTYDLEKLSDNIKNNSKDFQKMAFLGNVLFSALSHTKAGKWLNLQVKISIKSILLLYMHGSMQKNKGFAAALWRKLSYSNSVCIFRGSISSRVG